MDNWMRNNPGKRITIYDIPSLVTTAHNSSLTPKNIKSGFEKAGIFPSKWGAMGHEQEQWDIQGKSRRKKQKHDVKHGFT